MVTATAQDLGHPASHDYAAGSPHLRHSSIHDLVVNSLRSVILTRAENNVTPHILEIGAGHGPFTDHLVAAGARVTVTEMSTASARLLRERYRGSDAVRVLFDHDGDLREVADDAFDVVACVSVLHHIPDYLAALETMIGKLRPGGAFVSFQDPLWYPRRSRWSMAVDRGSFYTWRITRGDLIEGVRSVARRVRNAMDDANPRDTVEYHVLRQGCDEQAIVDTLTARFERVELHRYWSTPSALWQRVGERLNWSSAFGVVAERLRAS